jgi:hypothetical protein
VLRLVTAWAALASPREISVWFEPESLRARPMECIGKRYFTSSLCAVSVTRIGQHAQAGPAMPQPELEEDMSRSWHDVVTVTLGALVFAASLSSRDSVNPMPHGAKAAIELAAKRSKSPSGRLSRDAMALSLMSIHVEGCAASHG